MALTSSSLLMEGESGGNVAQALHNSAMNQQQLGEQGIFDRLEKKMDEKERALAEYEVAHSKNLVKAQRQAELIAAGGLDDGDGPKTIDEEIGANLDKIDATPIKKLAGMKENKKKQNAQGLSQQKTQKPIEEDEPRDDFEGFGSITAMVQNKDKLVEKTMADDQFQADLKKKQQDELAAVLKAKLDKQAQEKAIRDAKQKEAQAKKDKISQAKAKLQAVLDKSVKKKRSISSRAQELVTTPAPVPAPVVAEVSMPAPVAPAEPVVSQNAYQKAISSVLKKPKPSLTQATHVEPTVIAGLHKAKESDDEPSGFIGKYSKKINDQEVASQVLQQQMQEQEFQEKQPKIEYSKSAPKHKGMLARAMEKDLLEQEQKEEKEKDALMQAAINDPSFQNHLNNLQAAPQPVLPMPLVGLI